MRRSQIIAFNKIENYLTSNTEQETYIDRITRLDESKSVGRTRKQICVRQGSQTYSSLGSAFKIKCMTETGP